MKAERECCAARAQGKTIPFPALVIQGRGLERDLLRADHCLRCLGKTPTAVKQRTSSPEGQPLSSSRGDTSRHERTNGSREVEAEVEAGAEAGAGAEAEAEAEVEADAQAEAEA
ncbi:hypothetical protein CYMTET_36621 [Cymbomonas tetramitiformis]|uniref:Uncharacterized protein n=1 Tax=Cymbomonas tetramitiformis TaxID=36881 RepID=A0AAE0F7T2_9CHLO|nr:hypothetical protein CYMTET_36621 [Cymbomonas tetramitiformis]